MKNRIYTTALYSMEMAVEISLKALLLEFQVNVPKTHNVINTLRNLFEEKNAILPKEFSSRKDFILDAYNDLLEIRPLVGYTFEVNMSIDPEEKAKQYIKSTKEIVNLCDLAIRHIKRKK